jgi:hypothetical protein
LAELKQAGRLAESAALTPWADCPTLLSHGKETEIEEEPGCGGSGPAGRTQRRACAGAEAHSGTTSGERSKSSACAVAQDGNKKVKKALEYARVVRHIDGMKTEQKNPKTMAADLLLLSKAEVAAKCRELNIAPVESKFSMIDKLS